MSFAEIRERKMEGLRAKLSRRDETYTSGKVPKSQMGDCILKLRGKIKKLSGKLGASASRIKSLSATVEKQEQEIEHLRQIIAALRRVA